VVRSSSSTVVLSGTNVTSAMMLSAAGRRPRGKTTPLSALPRQLSPGHSERVCHAVL